MNKTYASSGLSPLATNTCFCIGPQNGDPLCPCRMRGLRQRDGRWVEEIDHGPVVRAPYNPMDRPCLHDQCSNCHGTGTGKDGGTCVHNISCPCPKCTVR